MPLSGLAFYLAAVEEPNDKKHQEKKEDNTADTT